MRREQSRYIFSSEITRRHQRTRKRRAAVLLVLVGLVVSFFLANFLISRHVVLQEVKITMLDLPNSLEKFSILHLSDLHGARYGEKQKAIENALSDTRYSCVVMTGDMLGENQDVEPLLELIDRLSPDIPIYYLPGDSDGDFIDDTAHSDLSVYTGWAQRLMEAGVQILDRPIALTREDATVWFVPEDMYTMDLDVMEWNYKQQLKSLEARMTSLTADDAARKRALEQYYLERIQAIRASIGEFKTGDIQIVVTHKPLEKEYVEQILSWTEKVEDDYMSQTYSKAEKEKVFSMRYTRLVLAGHYNGGQWRIPFVGALYVPEKGWLPDDSEIQGLNYLRETPQYISPGLGSAPQYTWQPGRLFNSPVITRIILTRYDQ